MGGGAEANLLINPLYNLLWLSVLSKLNASERFLCCFCGLLPSSPLFPLSLKPQMSDPDSYTVIFLWFSLLPFHLAQPSVTRALEVLSLHPGCAHVWKDLGVTVPARCLRQR